MEGAPCFSFSQGDTALYRRCKFSRKDILASLCHESVAAYRGRDSKRDFFYFIAGSILLMEYMTKQLQLPCKPV